MGKCHILALTWGIFLPAFQTVSENIPDTVESPPVEASRVTHHLANLPPPDLELYFSMHKLIRNYTLETDWVLGVMA